MMKIRCHFGQTGQEDVVLMDDAKNADRKLASELKSVLHFKTNPFQNNEFDYSHIPCHVSSLSITPMRDVVVVRPFGPLMHVACQVLLARRVQLHCFQSKVC
jgi:hypothetical protein